MERHGAGYPPRVGTEEEAEARTVSALELACVDGERGDLVFAFTGGETLDLYGLSLLLTAQQMALAADREVWVAGLSRRSWMLLKALGLEGLFKAFPHSSELVA